MRARLAVIETHPIQYHAPLYRMLEQAFGIPVTAIYGSDFSVAGYRDAEFGAVFQWDTDLLSGYDARFLSTVAKGGAGSAELVTTEGLGEMLDALKPAAVMLVGYSPKFHRDAFWTAWRHKDPLLFRGETTDHARQRSAWKQWARATMLRWYYARFGALLYVGQRSRRHFEALGVPAAKLFFSPYCVDTAPFRLNEHDTLRAETRAAYGIAPHRRVVLLVGKLVAVKTPEMVLQAMKQLATDAAFAERDTLTLLVVGDGELRAAMETLAAETPQIDARFVGFQNQSALTRFYHAADVLVMPSRGDTWGLVVNEALYHGVPCVVSDRVGCAPDLVTAGETGEVFRFNAAGDLAAALRRALGYTGREETRGACLRRAEEYGMKRAAQGIAEAFERVIQGR